MTFAAIFSYLALLLSGQRTLRVKFDPSHRRAFKGSELEFGLVFEPPGEERKALVELRRVPEGAEARLVPRGEHGRKLVVGSKFSGVFTGWSLEVGILDPIGIFSRTEERRIDLSAEFLPVSLLAESQGIAARTAVLGDRPAGSRGFGQEFYTAEIYDGSRDSKGILWKRQAKLGMDALMVRVGEANIPESLTVRFVEAKTRPPRELPAWMDLASEAISLIGTAALETGSSLRVIHEVGSRAAAAEARDLKGLADLLVWIWQSEPRRESSGGAVGASIVVTGEAVMVDPRVFGLLVNSPSVVLTYAKGRASKGAQVVFFTGRESMAGLVSTVLSR